MSWRGWRLRLRLRGRSYNVPLTMCDQRWTEPMQLALSRARHEEMAGRPEEDMERITAASLLTEALRVDGQRDEVLFIIVCAFLNSRTVFS